MQVAAAPMPQFPGLAKFAKAATIDIKRSKDITLYGGTYNKPSLTKGWAGLDDAISAMSKLTAGDEAAAFVYQEGTQFFARPAYFRQSQSDGMLKRTVSVWYNFGTFDNERSITFEKSVLALVDGTNVVRNEHPGK
jgi:hypothetical protein